MMPTHLLTVQSFADRFEKNPTFGIVSVNLAAELLGVQRSTLLTMEQAQFVKVEGKTDTLGVDAAWLRAAILARRTRDARMSAVTAAAVRQHIEQRLACTGFGNGKEELIEYGAHLMAPFGLEHHIGNHRKLMGGVLGEVSIESFLRDHIILSAVVVNKTGANKGRPSEGFWNLVKKDFGFVLENAQEEEAFWREQLRLIRQYIARHVVCPCENCAVPGFLRRAQPAPQESASTFSGSLAFHDEGYAPLEVRSLQACDAGVRIVSDYEDANGLFQLNGVAFKTGVDRHTGKDLYQTGMLPRVDADGKPAPGMNASLLFTMDSGKLQRHITGVWMDEGVSTPYPFSGDVEVDQDTAL